jgi:hypothetical protein
LLRRKLFQYFLKFLDDSIYTFSRGEFSRFLEMEALKARLKAIWISGNYGASCNSLDLIVLASGPMV